MRTSLARLEQLDIGDQALTFGRIDRVRPRRGGTGDGLADGDRPGRGRDLPHRPPGHPRRRPRAAGGGLAGAGGRALLPGHRPGPPGPGPAPPPGPGGTAGGRARGRALRAPVGGPRGRPRPTGPPTARDRRRADRRATAHRRPGRAAGRPGPGPLRPDGRHRLHHPAASRTRSSGPRWPGSSWCRAGPGTGKTAVALHRAAYLLYTHRFPLERQGVLVVGPNPLFLRYIEQVLPSLGETGVTLSTVSGLVPEIRVREPSPAEVARLKGDARMAQVVARAVRTRQRPLPEDVAVPFGALLLRLTAEPTAGEIVEGPPPARHPQRPPAVGRAVGGPAAGRPGPPDPADAWAVGSPARSPAFPGYEDPSELDRGRVRLRGLLPQGPPGARAGRGPRPDVAPAVPPRAAPRPVRGPAAPRRGRAGHPVGRRAGLLYRPRSASFDEVAWTPADAALVDEARHLLGPAQRRRPTTPSASTATSWSTRCRTCRPCSCAC